VARTRRLGPLVALGVLAAALAWAPAAKAGPIPWCGSGEPTVDASDAVNAFAWHVVYVVPADGTDRFDEYAPRIAGDVEALSSWWVGQDATRLPRFDLIDAPGCGSEYGRLDISFLRLKTPNVENGFRSIASDLVAAGLWSSDKAYLVYYEGVRDQRICGEGGGDNRVWAYAIVYLRACAQETRDNVRAAVAVHELLHGLGAVPAQAPHLCEDGHVCDSPSDVMRATVGRDVSFAATTLDAGRDDYYGHAGAWLDAQDSGLLYRLDTDLAPAPSVVGLTATNVGDEVHVQWAPAAPQAGVRYRVYDEEGRLVRDEPSSKLIDYATEGDTLTWTVRSVNDGGFLSPAATLRFKVGYGVVDAEGKLLRDTVAPASVRGLRASRSGVDVVLRWARVADPVGLRGYRITAPGMRPLLVAAGPARVPAVRVRGKKVSVAAVDRAGNVGTAATILVRR
jgi:hypothetical protein